jgi:hypothetical protein
MDETWRAEVSALRERAQEEPHGEVRLALVEEAVRIADLHGDGELGFQVRLELSAAAMFSGHPERMFVAFAWCRARSQADPARYQERLLWHYKWIAAEIISFPGISRAQIDATYVEMKRTFAAAGVGEQAYWKHEAYRRRHMGEPMTSIEEAFLAWMTTPRDWLSDCPACERNHEIAYHVHRSAWQTVLERAQPILAGRLRCTCVPQDTSGYLLYPMLKLGDLAGAHKLHHRMYPAIRGNLIYGDTIARHLEYLVLVGRPARALSVFEQHSGFVLDQPSPQLRFYLHAAAWLLFEHLVAVRKRSTAKLRLVAKHPLYRADHSYELTSVLAWIRGEATDLARRFDARNGTPSCTQRLANIPSLLAEIGTFGPPAEEEG